MGAAPHVAAKGLEHIVMGESTIAYVGGETGELHYRGFPIADLARSASFEGVVHLLLRGRPPAPDELDRLTADLAARRSVPDGVVRVLDALPPGLDPLEAMRTGMSALGDGSFPAPPTLEQGLDLIARTPTLLARHVRRSRHEAVVPPRPDLGHAANYLWMLTGEEPDAARARALEQYLILLADHGMNASTFALRVVLSTGSDLVSAATAALGALKGPVHGGAPALVAAMLDAIGRPAAAPAWIGNALARRDRLYGFGHRAYKTEDPRAIVLHSIARSAASADRLALAEAVEREALPALYRERPGRRLFTNVEYYGAVVLESVGLPPALFTPTFAVARTAGWAAHALEQVADNRLIRPDVSYVGPAAGRSWPAEVARA